MRKPTMALIEKSKLPFQLVTCKPLFNQVPEELDKAFEEGTITHDMYIVMLYLHRKADWGWGVARMMSAERIQKEAWGRVGRKEADTRPSVRTVHRILLRLRNCGWITLPDTTKRCSYNVGITNYAARIDGPVVQGDDDVAVLLRPTDIKDYDDVAPLVSHKMANKLTKQCPSSVADVSQECPSSDDVVSAIPDYRLQTHRLQIRRVGIPPLTKLQTQSTARAILFLMSRTIVRMRQAGTQSMMTLLPCLSLTSRLSRVWNERSPFTLARQGEMPVDHRQASPPVELMGAHKR